MARDLTVAAFHTQQARDMSERELLALVVEAATRLGAESYHTHDSRHSAAGWPDLVIAFKSPRICEPSTLIVAELKTMRGVVTPAQQCWLDHLASVGIATYVWRPQHWFDGWIQTLLTDAGG